MFYQVTVALQGEHILEQSSIHLQPCHFMQQLCLHFAALFDFGTGSWFQSLHLSSHIKLCVIL